MNPEVGQDVFFHAGGNIGPNYYSARIVKVGREVVDLVVFGRGGGVEMVECVRYWTDKKLVGNPNIRKDGCWSETPNPRAAAKPAAQEGVDAPVAPTSKKKPELAKVN